MRTVATALCASLFVVGVAAQGQQPAPQGQGEQPAAQGQPPAPPAQPPAPRAEQPTTGQAEKVVTISGCIQNAPPPAPAAGAAPSATATSKFELASAKVVSGGPVGTSGAAGATRYRLDGEEKTISLHLNHQVEITGTVSPAAPASGAAAAPMLKMESLKMIAAKCS